MISLEDASLTKKGIVKLSSATDSDSEALAATPKAVKTVMGEVRTKAPLDSPAFTGTPTTPTPPGDAKGLQTTNAEFVRKLIAALVGSVLEPLDTLQELADALGNDPNFATTVLNKLAGKQPLDETLTALSGKSVDGLIEYVGLRETISRAADALQKSQNGGDIPDKDLFVRRIGAARAFDGAVIEVMGVRGAMTIRVTTPTTTSGGGVASAQFTYIDNGDGYSPGWRRDYNTVNQPSAGEMGALSVNGGRLNGSLGIGTDNALGGNSIVFGDNDTGFKWHSDGVLGIYANNAQVGYIDISGLHMLADIRATGVVRAGNGKTLTSHSVSGW